MGRITFLYETSNLFEVAKEPCTASGWAFSLIAVVDCLDIRLDGAT